MNRLVKLTLYFVLAAAAAGLGAVFTKEFRSISDQSNQSRIDRIERLASDTPPASNPVSLAVTGTAPAASAPASSNGPAAAPAEPTAAVAVSNPPLGTLAQTSPPPAVLSNTLATEGPGTNPAATPALEAPAQPGTGAVAQAGTNRPAKARRHAAAAADEGDSSATRSYSRLMNYGFWLFLVVAALALLVAHDLSHLFAEKAVKYVFDDEGSTEKSPEYENAEQLWSSGKHLDAIQAMRDYLKARPREIYVAFRIAEIYETNLSNWLAAALEYEEILKQALPTDRWGWAAIHLANLYSGRLGKPQKAVEWLQRVDAECGEASSARKARERLAQLNPTAPAASAQAAPPPPAPEPDPLVEEPPRPSHGLPRGFRPKKP